MGIRDFKQDERSRITADQWIQITPSATEEVKRKSNSEAISPTSIKAIRNNSDSEGTIKVEYLSSNNEVAEIYLLSSQEIAISNVAKIFPSGSGTTVANDKILVNVLIVDE